MMPFDPLVLLVGLTPAEADAGWTTAARNGRCRVRRAGPDEAAAWIGADVALVVAAGEALGASGFVATALAQGVPVVAVADDEPSVLAAYAAGAGDCVARSVPQAVVAAKVQAARCAFSRRQETRELRGRLAALEALREPLRDLLEATRRLPGAAGLLRNGGDLAQRLGDAWPSLGLGGGGAVTSDGRPTAVSARPLEGVRVLLAEDTPDNQVLLCRILTTNGASVDVADNGAEALERAARSEYDVILMDIQMPVLDGYAATAALRGRGFGKPIIAVTAHARAEERDRCFAAGCDEHLTKPVNVARLVQTIARFVRQGDGFRAVSPH